MSGAWGKLPINWIGMELVCPDVQHAGLHSVFKQMSNKNQQIKKKKKRRNMMA